MVGAAPPCNYRLLRLPSSLPFSPFACRCRGLLAAFPFPMGRSLRRFQGKGCRRRESPLRLFFVGNNRAGWKERGRKVLFGPLSFSDEWFPFPLSAFYIVHSYAHKTYLFMDTIHMFALELVVVCNEIDRSAPRCKKDRVSIGY